MKIFIIIRTIKDIKADSNTGNVFVTSVQTDFNAFLQTKDNFDINRYEYFFQVWEDGKLIINQYISKRHITGEFLLNF